MDGLLMKYFVVNPGKQDWHGAASRAALRAYAKNVETENPALARDLIKWIEPLEQKRSAAPAIGSAWPGGLGIYAGVVRGDAGESDYHLVVANEDTKGVDWKAALEWAAALPDKASLPKRKEQAILFGNVPELFEKEWYWSCEEYAGASGYAWFQNFYDGGQDGYRKYGELRARAVRRFNFLTI